MSNPSLDEVMIQVLRTFDPEGNNGYGGAAYHQWERCRIKITRDAKVQIVDCDNENRAINWVAVFQPNQDKIFTATQNALQNALDCYRKDLCEAVNAATISLQESPWRLFLNEAWYEIAKHEPTLSHLKIHYLTLYGGILFGPTRYVDFTFPQYAKDDVALVSMFLNTKGDL